MNRSINNDQGVSILSILEDPTYQDLIKNKYIPDIVCTIDETFLHSVSKTFSDIGGELIKFLIINKNTKEITNDSEYEFTRFPKEGYLIRLSLPRRNTTYHFLKLDYIVDINNVIINEYMDNGVKKVLGFQTIEDISEIISEDNKSIFSMTDDSKKNLMLKYFDNPFNLDMRRRRGDW